MILFESHRGENLCHTCHLESVKKIIKKKSHIFKDDQMQITKQTA